MSVYIYIYLFLHQVPYHKIENVGSLWKAKRSHSELWHSLLLKHVDLHAHMRLLKEKKSAVVHGNADLQSHEEGGEAETEPTYCTSRLLTILTEHRGDKQTGSHGNELHNDPRVDSSCHGDDLSQNPVAIVDISCHGNTSPVAREEDVHSADNVELVGDDDLKDEPPS